MAQFSAIDQEVEVNGQTILSVVAGMAMNKWLAMDILKEKGIEDPQPGKWYPQQKWLDAFKEISEKIGDQTLYRIGRQIPENADWPPFVKDVKSALSSIDIAYHMNHRKNGMVLFDPQTGKMIEGIGHYRYKDLGERKAEVVCDNPYPCAFDKGIIEAAADKFKPEGAKIIIEHNMSISCRKGGEDVCTYVVSW